MPRASTRRRFRSFSSYAFSVNSGDRRTPKANARGLRLGASRLLVTQKLNDQRAHLLRLFLLHPVPSALQQMKAQHSRTRGGPHSVDSTRRLIDSPVAPAGHVHRWHIDRSARERAQVGEALGIGPSSYSVALKRTGKFGPRVFGGVDLDLRFCQPFAT